MVVGSPEMCGSWCVLPVQCQWDWTGDTCDIVLVSCYTPAHHHPATLSVLWQPPSSSMQTQHNISFSSLLPPSILDQLRQQLGCDPPGLQDRRERRDSEEPAVKLESSQLWEQFHHIGTEMVITKSGRSVIAMVVVVEMRVYNNQSVFPGKCFLR